jgi:hypothetical protein
VKHDNGLSNGAIAALLVAYFSPDKDIQRLMIGEEIERQLNDYQLIIRKTASDPWRCTQRGIVFVEHLRTIPLPVQRWIVPEVTA